MGIGYPKTTNRNQKPRKPEAYPVQKRNIGSRKEDQNNKISITTSGWKPPSQDIHYHDWGGALNKMAGLISSVQSEEKNSMVAEIMEEYALASAESAYKNPG